MSQPPQERRDPANGLLAHFFGPPHSRRVCGLPILYSEGGYFTHPTPQSLEYLYFCLENAGTRPFESESFCFELRSGGEIWDLGLPQPGVHGQIVQPGGGFVIAFLRDRLSIRLRDWLYLDDPCIFRACCRCKGGEVIRSAEISLSLDFPVSPLQDSGLMEYAGFLTRRVELFTQEIQRLRNEWGSLAAYAGLHHELGMHKLERDGKLWPIEIKQTASPTPGMAQHFAVLANESCGKGALVCTASKLLTMSKDVTVVPASYI